MVIWFCKAVIVLVIAYAVYRRVWNAEYDIPRESTIKDRATVCTYPIGNYDEKLRNSVRYWSYEFFAEAYKQGVYEAVKTAAYDWWREQNEPGTFILEGLDLATKQIEEEVETARTREDQKPLFKHFDGYDYHVVAKSMLYNDHIDCSTLAAKLDKIFGGRNG